jgi:hypothetical protein
MRIVYNATARYSFHHALDIGTAGTTGAGSTVEASRVAVMLDSLLFRSISIFFAIVNAP